MTCIRQRRKDGVRLDGLRQLSSEAPMGCASTTYAPTRPAPSFGRPEKTATVRAASASKVHHEEGPQAGESDAGRNAPATRKRKTRVAHSATKSWLSLELTKAAHAVSSSVIALYSSTPPPPKACSASHRAPIHPNGLGVTGVPGHRGRRSWSRCAAFPPTPRRRRRSSRTQNGSFALCD